MTEPIAPPDSMLRRTLTGLEFFQRISDGTLATHLFVTVWVAIVGFILGSLAGLVIGLLLGRAVTLAKIIDPFLMAFYSMPKVALAPVFVLVLVTPLLLGYGSYPWSWLAGPVAALALSGDREAAADTARLTALALLALDLRVPVFGAVTLMSAPALMVKPAPLPVR